MAQVDNNEPAWVFPYQFMRVGHSFFIPTLRPPAMIHAADLAAKRDGIRVKCYVTTHEGLFGVRVWRVG